MSCVPFREPMEYIMRSRPAFKACSAPHPSRLRRATFPQGKAFVQRKPPRESEAVSLCWHYLSFRQVTLQVLSARTSLTSVFGMGTGGPSSQSIPTHVGCTRQLLCQKPELLTSGAPSGTRTRDPLIKSQLLYQLS